MSSAQIAFDVLVSKAEQRDELTTLDANLTHFAWLYRVNFDFRQWVASMSVPLDQILECISEIPGFVPCQTFYELVAAIIQNRLFLEIDVIASRYTELLAKRMGQRVATVVTPVPLDDATAAKLSTSLAVALGFPVMVKNEVDPTLISGTLFKLPNGKQFDFSAKKQLTEIKSHILEGVL